MSLDPTRQSWCIWSPRFQLQNRFLLVGAAEPTTDFGGLQTLRPQPGMPGCLMQVGSVVSLDYIAQIGPKDADALRSHT